MTTDEIYMKRCLELAKQGLGLTAPNPLVGSVIVHNGLIIGEGFHRRFGDPHAEVNAINSVKNKSLLKDSVLYVNLEPCSHMGKTPPCADFIVSHEIQEVVIGSVDPNVLVKGRGIKKLQESGIKVKTGILKEECLEVNKRFFSWHVKKRPYIILKWAQTKDGFIDIKRTPDTPVQPNWISGEQSRMLVHKWRSEEQAIMVGTNTVIFDNPNLTTREWFGRDPLRIFPDNSLRVPRTVHLYDNEKRTLVFNGKKTLVHGNTEFRAIDFKNGNVLEQILNELHNREIQSLLVEGGKKLLESFINSNLWDEARVFTGDKIFKEGIESPGINRNPTLKISIERDILHIYQNYQPADYLAD